MAEGIVYLDVDDEITSAAQRIRSAAGTRVALVVPYGSRIATSRMNFRLLSREAVMNNRRLSIVSGDAAARSLAASAGPAGLRVGGASTSRRCAEPDASARDADGGRRAPPRRGPGSGRRRRSGATAAASLAASETVGSSGGRRRPRLRTPQVAAPPAARRRRTTATATPTVPAVPAATAAGALRATDRRAAADAPARGPSPRPSPTASTDDDARLPPILGGRIRGPTIVAAGLVALALVVAGVGAYLFLPSAVDRPRPAPRCDRPDRASTVSADPDGDRRRPRLDSVVPALRLDVPVEAARTFTTTGTHVEEAAARGSVTFTNYDTSSGVSIPSGSVVSTEGGARFRTQRTVALQPASDLPGLRPDVRVRPGPSPSKPGEAGNVPANTIRVVPQGQNPVLLRVNNPADTSGGTHTETPEVSQAEVDKAVAALQAELRNRLRRRGRRRRRGAGRHDAVPGDRGRSAS